MRLNYNIAVLSAVTITVLIVWICISYTYFSQSAADTLPTKADSNLASSVELSETQLNSIKIEPVVTYRFTLEKKAVGSVAYHEQIAAHVQPSVLPWHPEGVPAPNPSIKFVIANISESDSPLIHTGQPVEVKMQAYPDRIFDGKVSVLGVTVYDSGGNPAIDPNTHRITVRCEISDPKNELYPGMLANIAIQVQEPVESVAIPENGVVRKGDGTMTAWITTDHQHFEERTVKVGLQQNGYDQILDGLRPADLVATDGAVFLNNMLYAPPSD